MQILIIEDEPRAANQLRKLLAESELQVDLLGIIDTIEEAIDFLITRPAPELIFMDIQLADGLSFEIFQHVEVSAPIIFTTAFDQYAIQAFKVNSIDYLLKPIKQSDLDHAIAKFLRSTKNNFIEAEVLKELLWKMQGPSSREGILVKEGNAFVQLTIDDLLYIYSEDSITFGVTTSKRYMIDETLDQLFATLNEIQFYRINRSQIISKKAVEKIEPYFNHRLKLTMRNTRDQEFVVSRAKSSDFKRWINQ